MTKLPSGSTNTLTKRWVFYDAMEFLLHHVRPRQTSSNVPTLPNETEEAPQYSSCSSNLEMQGNAPPLEATATIVCGDINTVTPTLLTSKPRFTQNTAGSVKMRLIYISSIN